MTVAGIHHTILAVWRIEQPRLITSLARMLRDVPLAEDLTQEALLAALEHWPATGIPEKPGAWLMAAAQRRAHQQKARTKARDSGWGKGEETTGPARWGHGARRRHRRRAASARLHRLSPA